MILILRERLVFASLVVLFLGVFAKSSPLLAENSVKRKIGVSLGLTGNLASIGAGIRNAILLAKKENDPGDSVEFIFEDDGYEPKRTVTAVNRFLDQEKVDGLIVFGSGTALAVNGIAERNKVPMIALGNSKKIVEGKSYVMMHFLNTDTENEAVVEEVRKRPYRKIAVVCSSHDAMLDLGSAFVKALPERIALSLDVAPSDTDFRSIISRIKASGADAVYNVLLPAPRFLPASFASLGTAERFSRLTGLMTGMR